MRRGEAENLPGLLREDGWPQSEETARLGRRVHAIRWFLSPHEIPRDNSERLAESLSNHATAVGLEAPTTARVLSATEGRRALSEGHIDPFRPRWDQALKRRFHSARAEVVQTQRAKGHPALVVSGDALLVRPEALPLDAETLARRLQGSPAESFTKELLQHLVDRVLWEMGALFTWELVGDLLGPNPFAPLLGVYEEGLYPLDLDGGTAVLWAPFAAPGA